ncbi:Rne/Rng family ribonuclease [Psychrobacter sp. HD31]|uniref:ribonuclease E/G n=1 Tax=Psychrobacter sp. HD31 TaxID=3112003 RepID=UPI003DA2C92A
MKRILINATHNEEIRVALCKGNHLYDFDLENRTREQKKSNIYKAHVTRVEPSLEAVFVEYGAQRQGFLPIREIAKEYLKGGNPRDTNIRELIKEGDTLIVQVEKEERGNKGAALSTYVSLAGRYLVLMPNNPRGGGISRQISGKMREDIKRILGNLDMPKGMSVIVRTAGIGKTEEDLQHDLNHLVHIWNAIGEQDKNYPSPRLVHQEAGVVTRAVRDYLRDDIAEVWLDNEAAYNEAASFISAVMPKQIDKLRKYTDYEPMFARFGIEKQIETAYQREVNLPSGGSIVIDQTEAMVAIDINSAKSTKGSDVAETAYHTNLEAADEIARQLRLRDMGGLVVIDFIDMYEPQHQKDVEKRLIDATKYDRARVQFGEISRFGLMEMSRQRLRPSLEESTGYKCPRCHGTGMVRDLRSLSLSIMRQIEQIALKERQGEVQAEVPTDIAAFLLNEKRDSLVYLEQDSGTRITILPHAHLESPHFNLHYNRGGFAPSSYERISDTHEQETSELGYDVNWQTADTERPEQQPTRKPRKGVKGTKQNVKQQKAAAPKAQQAPKNEPKPQAAAWLSNLFAPTPQAQTSDNLTGCDAAQAIEALVNSGAQSLGSFGQVDINALAQSKPQVQNEQDDQNEEEQNKKRRRYRKEKTKSRKKERRQTNEAEQSTDNKENNKPHRAKREPNSKRDSRGEFPRGETLSTQNTVSPTAVESAKKVDSDKPSEKKQERRQNKNRNDKSSKARNHNKRNAAQNPQKNANEVNMQVVEQAVENVTELKDKEVVHLSLDNSKPVTNLPAALSKQAKQNKTKPEHKATSDVTNSTSNASTLATPEEPSVEASNVKAGKVDSVESNHSDKNESAAAYLFADIFADRYITAHKFAQAKNDPRVVRANLAQTQAVTAPLANQPIKGNVGEFIRATLEDAEAHLAKDGVIACFIQAVAKTQNSAVSAADTNAEANLADFDFSNYGYEPLMPEYLANFTAMTQPVAQFNAVQGKTAVEPTAIGKRAANDPRGQHPDYVEPEPIIAEPVEEVTLDVAVTEEDAKPAESADTANQTPDAFDAAFGQLLAEEETSLSDDEPANEAEVAHQQDGEHTEVSETILPKEEVDEVSSPEQVSSEDEADDPERGKTSFDEYRDMLANVSEQLSTKTVSNSLFLSTPTIPKTRSRKKKDTDK